MSENIIPATEAQELSLEERATYEFAFHVLPTVAEGEVADVVATLKTRIAQTAAIIDEEVPERTDLVYPIVKMIEGKNRKFTSAYFGWVRFTAEPEKIAELVDDLSHVSTILRHILIKLTPVEIAHPFRFHEHRKSAKMVTVVHEDETIETPHTEAEENVVVSEEALDESLEKITHDEMV